MKLPLSYYFNQDVIFLAQDLLGKVLLPFKFNFYNNIQPLDKGYNIFIIKKLLVIENQLSEKMKITKSLIETVLPIIVGTLFIVGYFFITDNFFRETSLENCKSCFPSNLDYLIYIIVIVIPLSLYQLTIGNSILKKYHNSFKASSLNSIVFAVSVTGILVIANLFLKKMEWDFYPVIFLILVILGILFTLFIKLCRKMVGNKFIN